MCRGLAAAENEDACPGTAGHSDIQPRAKSDCYMCKRANIFGEPYTTRRLEFEELGAVAVEAVQRAKQRRDVAGSESKSGGNSEADIRKDIANLDELSATIDVMCEELERDATKFANDAALTTGGDEAFHIRTQLVSQVNTRSQSNVMLATKILRELL
jgi:hypothetical protein